MLIFSTSIEAAKINMPPIKHRLCWLYGFHEWEDEWKPSAIDGWENRGCKGCDKRQCRRVKDDPGTIDHIRK